MSNSRSKEKEPVMPFPPRQANFLGHDTTTNLPTGTSFNWLTGTISLREYATEFQLTADGTAALQQAINDARDSLFASNTFGATVLLPAGHVNITQVTIPEGVSLRGAGSRATELWQLNGQNKSMILTPATLAGIAFYPHVTITNMALRKQFPTTDTLGSAIEMNCRVGELCHFRDLYITAFPEDGIRLNRGAQPLVMQNIHVFGCGGYGINLRRTNGDVWHMISLDGMSGDNHGKGLIHLQTGGSAMEAFRIANVKAECLVENTMPCVIDMDGLNNTAVQLENIMVYGIKPIPTVLRVSSSRVKILGGLVRAIGTTNLVVDVEAGRTIPYDPTLLQFIYDSNQGLGTLESAYTWKTGLPAGA
jgi:hypothetical protein